VFIMNSAKHEAAGSPTAPLTRTDRRRPSGCVAVSLFAGFALCVSVTVNSSGQDLGEIARQERQRRQNQTHPPIHVYTDEDLKRAQILLPGDRARFLEATKATVSPDHGGMNAQASDEKPQTAQESNPAAIPLIPELSLGEIARRYRAEKETAEAERKWLEALNAQPQRFSLAMPAPLAAPDRTKLSRVPSLPTDATAQSIGQRLLAGQETEPQPPAAVQVQAGDTLWGLARTYLGSGTQWRRLMAANPGINDPRQLRAGAWINLPAVDDSAARNYPKKKALSVRAR
jgi:LysM repeat protein